MRFGSFKNGIYKNVFTNHIYLIYMYKKDFAWNNLQKLICYKTKPNQINKKKKLSSGGYCNPSRLLSENERKRNDR